MATYLIIYETQSEITQKILDGLIKNLGESMQITSNLWALKTEIPAKELRNSLRDQLSNKDRLMVVKSGREAAWYNSLCPNNWIVDNF
ncbi:MULTISPECIES: hypothetical protein [unclassified Pseudomonas]|uniref:hypothetical protein n=1 Tax=unclassified Pseudomonas TaxID=196821 RepID=UPI000A1F4C3C|nr:MULTISPECIES: hypothetical protein [unclassified Pseudomonas]